LKGSAIFRTIATLGLTTVVALAQNPTQRAQQAFALGVERQRKGDLAGARHAYEEAHRLAPRRVDVLSNLGLVFSEMGKQDSAIQCFKDALKVDLNQRIVRFNLGLAYMRAGQFEPAQAEFTRVLKAQPANLAAHHLRGLCLLKLGRDQDGIEDLEAVFHARPQDPNVAYTLASAYIKANQLDKAEPLIHDLEKQDSAEAHFIVGSYYLEKLDHRRAVKEFTQVVERNPTFPDAHAQLAYAYFFESKWDLSVKMCEEELAFDPDDDNAVKLLGSLYRQRGRLDEAAALLDKAARQDPNDYEILYQIGLLDVAKNDYSRAVAVLEKVTRLNPDFPPAHITLVRTYGKLKRSDDAQREQGIVDRLDAQRKNQPTVRDKALYDAFKIPGQSH